MITKCRAEANGINLLLNMEIISSRFVGQTSWGVIRYKAQLVCDYSPLLWVINIKKEKRQKQRKQKNKKAKVELVSHSWFHNISKFEKRVSCQDARCYSAVNAEASCQTAKRRIVLCNCWTQSHMMFNWFCQGFKSASNQIDHVCFFWHPLVNEASWHLTRNWKPGLVKSFSLCLLASLTNFLYLDCPGISHEAAAADLLV